MSQAIKLSGLLLCLTLSGAAVAAEPGSQVTDGLSSIKLAVKDFKVSTDFYVKYYGMKEGQRYNSHEQGLDWPVPGKGSSLLLVRDDPEQSKLVRGAVWVIMVVPDAKKIAKQMVDDGVKDVGEIHDLKQFNTAVFIARDPDGNQVETIQLPAKTK